MKYKLRNKINLIENLSQYLTSRINVCMKKEGVELLKLKLGLEIILINLSKFIVIFSVASYFSLFKEALLMCLVFGSIRKNAFGLHARSSLVCTILSLTMFVLGAYISFYLLLNNYIVFPVFLIINMLLYKYAPGDTEAHPLVSKKLRNKLKKKSVSTGIILMILALAITNPVVKTLITLASCYEAIIILPITYKILNRRYKNYERYEGANV